MVTDPELLSASVQIKAIVSRAIVATSRPTLAGTIHLASGRPLFTMLGDQLLSCADRKKSTVVIEKVCLVYQCSQQ